MTACSALVTSIITPPFSISARPVLRRREVELPLFWDMGISFLGASFQLSVDRYQRTCGYFTARSRFAVPPGIVISRQPPAISKRQPGFTRMDSRGRLSPHELMLGADRYLST